jgi:hypothetical protein
MMAAKAKAAKSKAPRSSTGAAPRTTSAHGGRANVGVRKAARPLDLKKPIRVTLKSKWAKGKLALNTATHRPVVDEIIRERAQQFGIVIRDIENTGDTVRITLKTKSREPFQHYLRTMSALIARRVTGARRGKPFGKRFWDHLAFTETIEE